MEYGHSIVFHNKIRYAKHMKKLAKIAEKIRLKADESEEYSMVYSRLKEAILMAEQTKLIYYRPETKKEWK